MKAFGKALESGSKTLDSWAYACINLSGLCAEIKTFVQLSHKNTVESAVLTGDYV